MEYYNIQPLLFLLGWVVGTVHSNQVAADPETIQCPQDGQEIITMAGTEPAQRLVEAWKEAYVKACPNADIRTEGGGYAMGAARVCNNHIVYNDVDIGGMQGAFFAPQATTENGWEFQCEHSEREVTLVSTGVKLFILLGKMSRLS